MKFPSSAILASLKRRSSLPSSSSLSLSVQLSSVSSVLLSSTGTPFATPTLFATRTATSTRQTSLAMFSSSSSSSSPSVSGDDMLKDFRSNGRPTATLVGLHIADAMHALANADIVCFDVDSTVITEEGIDVLAEFLGKGPQVSALTKQAMEGGMKFQDALAARLQLLQPSRDQIQACLKAHPFGLTPGVEPLIHALRDAGKVVYLVSGGFRIMIEPIAVRLQLDPFQNVVANQILFDPDTGAYAGFDTQEPTSQDMGKPKALHQIQAAAAVNAATSATPQSPPPNMVMIGDGATDAQAKPPAQAFIGFGGVVVRESVRSVADWFVTDFDDLTYIVQTYGSSKK